MIHFRSICRILLSRDYLPLGNAVRPDVKIWLSDQDLEFYDEDELVLKSSRTLGHIYRLHLFRIVRIQQALQFTNLGRHGIRNVGP